MSRHFSLLFWSLPLSLTELLSGVFLVIEQTVL